MNTNKYKIATRIPLLLGILFLCLGRGMLHGAGTVTPTNAAYQPMEIRDHQVNVTLNNGFAQTEVIQEFFNPNPDTLEAIYTFPVPQHASLSEVTIWAGEKELQGEVLPRQEADRIYEEEVAQGNSAGKASRESYQRFEFQVYPVPAQSSVRMRVVYYQPLELDTGVGRYLYPLEEGNTDEAALSFWTQNQKVDGNFSIRVTLKSAWAIADIRTPGYAGAQSTDEHGNIVFEYQNQTGDLNQDFLLYYRLVDDLPGRVEVIPYRDASDKPGSFMMIVTPGIDLQPLSGGADYVFVLDVSGSMDGKLHTLVKGIEKALTQMQPQDRFRVVAFNNNAFHVIESWTPATSESVEHALGVLRQLQSNGGTNVYEGLQLGLKKLDDDRATSLILVTDGVTNQGIVDPARFRDLMQKQDIRVFGFLMGNSSNWPLMEVITEASGGFYKAVSNSDDIVGQIILAKNKVLYEALHDAQLEISGGDTFDLSQMRIGKIYRGQQLVFFGRYDQPGQARLTLKARLTGEDKVYQTVVDFPETDTANPEIERLWAMDRIEAIEHAERLGDIPAGESESVITSIAVEYQLVTDHTSMIVLDDETFQRHGIERRNRERVQRERQAQAQRQLAAPVNRRADTNQPMFKQKAPRPSFGGGGGAIDPFSALAALFMITLSVLGKKLGLSKKGD